MTAAVVDGVDVVADEPTKSPITDRGGNPVYFQQTRTLLLADGRVVYGCLHCDETFDRPGPVRPHLRKHKPDQPAKPKTKGQGGAIGVLARELEKVTTDRDAWKARAKKAERSLATLRRALQGDG